MFATVQDVKDFVSLSSDDISDEEIMKLIKRAQIQIAQELYVYHEEELVTYIDAEKENDIDGENTIFYTRYWPIADRTQSGVVDENDVTMYLFDSDNVRTTATVTSVDSTLGKITLSSAPGTDYTLKVTYNSIPKNIRDDDLKLACTFLAAGYCYLKVEPAVLKHLDTLDVIRMPDAANRYFNQYKDTMKRIKSEIGWKAKDVESVTFEDLRNEFPLRKYYAG